jgi:threonine aldolase
MEVDLACGSAILVKTLAGRGEKKCPGEGRRKAGFLIAVAAQYGFKKAADPAPLKWASAMANRLRRANGAIMSDAW